MPYLGPKVDVGVQDTCFTKADRRCLGLEIRVFVGQEHGVVQVRQRMGFSVGLPADLCIFSSILLVRGCLDPT
jgi:hypothetical protein